MIQAINIPTFHLDGTFQTASGLFRLNANQLPGKDFFPYLGIGPIFTLFPLFKVLGANLAASIIASQFMTLLMGALSLSFLWQLIWQPKSFSTSMIAGFILYVIPIASASYFSFRLPYWFAFETSPGNSLRPIRAFAPYLWMMGYYFFTHNIASEKIKYALIGILSSLILLWSNDYAIPTIGLFSLFLCLHSLCLHKFNIKNILIYFFIMITSWIILLQWITQGYAFSLLDYNFIDVAQDQWWYFGGYDKLNRIFGLSQLGKLISPSNYLPLIVLAITAIISIRSLFVRYVIVFWVGFALFAGGIVATIGGHIDRYFDAFYFWGAATFILTAFYLTWRITSIFFRKIISEQKMERVLIWGLCVASLVTMITCYRVLQTEFSAAKIDSSRFYVPELGGYLNREWEDYINLIKSTDSTQVIEEYWGVWSATRKINSIWPVDSVIAALGSKREISANKLHEADIIVTTRYRTSLFWQPWNLSQNYWFYEELIENWTPEALSPTTIVWRKNNKARVFKKIDCVINNQSKILTLNVSSPGFYEVALEYKLSGHGRFLLMAKNNLSYSAGSNGFVSLNPRGHNTKFPVYIPNPEGSALPVQVIGISKPDIHLIQCAARHITFDNREVLHEPYFLHFNHNKAQ